MTYEIPQFSRLVNSADPVSVISEVKTLMDSIWPDFDNAVIDKVGRDVIDLFQGRYLGYLACNTEYHNLAHTTDALLAMIRLIHGASVAGESISSRNALLACIATLLHDSGYIQHSDEVDGTGARFTLTHITRSIQFMETYFRQNGFSTCEFENCRVMLECTGLGTKIADVNFANAEIGMLGRMLGTADLLGQMADRAYLEKLLFLYYEFSEGSVAGYESELQLLKKTLEFYDVTKVRFAQELSGVNRFLRFHFEARHQIDADLYDDAMKKNRLYLADILENHEHEYREYLRRDGIVAKLKTKEN